MLVRLGQHIVRTDADGEPRLADQFVNVMHRILARPEINRPADLSPTMGELPGGFIMNVVIYRSAGFVCLEHDFKGHCVTASPISGLCLTMQSMGAAYHKFP